MRESLSSKAQTAEVFDRIARHFDTTRRFPWDEVAQYVRALPRMSVAADIGCGNGRHIPYLCERASMVLAIDFSTEMLSLARKNIDERGLLNVSFILADSSHLPLKEGTLDGFIYIAALHHLPSEEDRVKSLESLRRCLKNGARGLISVWALDQPRFQPVMQTAREGDILVPWRMPDGRRYDRFYHLFRDDELRALIKRSGFRMERMYRSRDNYFAEVANH